MSWEVLPVEVPGADTENVSLEPLPTEVPRVDPENISLELLPVEMPGVDPENMSKGFLPMEVPRVDPESMSKGFLPMEEPGVYPENMSKGFLPMEVPRVDPESMSKGFLPMEVPRVYPESMSKGFLPMEVPRVDPESMSKGFLPMEVPRVYPESMSKGFLPMEEPGVYPENMSKGFLPMEEPGVYPENMSKGFLPMEVPETLYYTKSGKTMMPSDALEDENSGFDPLGDGEQQKRRDDSTVPDQGDFKIESSPCFLLTVRIIRMRNLQRVDALSQADCYVSLWLPTATCERSRTKTVRNSDNPVWNETFYFRIQSQVKNVLELTVYDEDFATPDDHLLCALFDTAKLPLERTVILYFKPSPNAKEELEVEFKLEVASGPHETIATNGVLVCRELCCLEVEVAEKTMQKSKKELSLTVKGSFEGTQDIVLGPNGVVSPSCPTEFHYIKYAEPTLDVMLPKKRHYHPWSCRYSTETGSPVVMLNSLPMGRKTTIAEEKRFDLNVTAKTCNCSCHQDLDMRFGFNLCSEEMAFLGKRKRYVASALKNVFHLPCDLQDQEVPVVAIITTGGGLKSMTGLYGSLMGLKKLNLLDCVTYISGLSGTTWTMANLYRDAYWSQKDLDSHIGEAQKQATKCKMGCFSMDRMKYYNKQLCQRKEEGYRTSFIDLWGLMIEYLLNDGKDPHKLSEQQEALCDGQNPLPIYVSVCVRDSYSTNDFKEWVEFTPYEVGLLKYGAFIRTEHFGSEFFMGRLLKKLPESRICYLQGMWSSIFSVNLLQIWGLSHSSEDFWKRWTQDRIEEVDEDPVLPTRPHELRTRMYTPPGPLSSALRGALTDRFSVAQHHNFLKGYQLHNNYMENQHFCRWKDTVLDTRPNQLMQNSDHLGMIDAGFFINTSSAPLLRPQREVDVIIYLSYTTGSHTSSLDKACKYYSEQKIPFPTISLTDEDKKNLKECYIFQDSDLPGCPIVIFLPLVNDTFQEYKAPGVKRCCSEMEEGQLDLTSRCSPYCMFSVRYTDENYRKLLNLSEYNILNNSQMIMQALQTAMQRRRQKMCCATSPGKQREPKTQLEAGIGSLGQLCFASVPKSSHRGWKQTSQRWGSESVYNIVAHLHMRHFELLVSVEAGRCEIALPQITLDVCVNTSTMDQDGILSQDLISQTSQQGDGTMQLNPDGKQRTSLIKIESSLCYLLTVRVIRARNIHQADVLSHTDCYVSLWLPTASNEKFQTKAIKNCKDPVWNETFYFRIQSQVKNVLELALYDKDVVTQDDHLFTVYFDIAKLSLGEEVFMHFKCDSQRQEELEVGFALDNISGPPETIITNGVLVSRKICCLEVQVVEKKTKKKKEKKSKKEFSFKVQGSYEGTQDIMLGSNLVFSSSSPAKFHYARYKQPMLDVTLPGKKRPPSSQSYVYDTRSPNVELHSIPSGKNMILAEGKGFDLYAKAEDCPDHLDVRLGFDLCIQEQDFLCKRQNYVIPALKKVLHLEQDLLDHETPVVAIMTTGGGMRSLTALYGSLRGLKKLNVLDCATYLTGLSGTTWTMSNLYRDADWSQKDLDKQISEARKHMTKCKINSFSLEYLKYYKKQLCQRKREGRKTSFIDLWGLVLESFLHDGKDNHRLSDQQRAIDHGQNPLPIYTAVNVKNNYSTMDFKEWVEFTPYEVGLQKYGVFVCAEDFGSEFFMGRLMKKVPESRICFLEGMWSSLFSFNVLYIWNLSHSSEDFWHRWTRDQIDNIEEEPPLPVKPQELRTRLFTPPGPLGSALRAALADRVCIAQEHNFLRGFQVHNDYLENTHFCRWKGPKLHVTGAERAEEKAYGKSPFPKDCNQLRLCGHGVRVENKLTSFSLLHLEQKKIFLSDTVLDTFPNQLTQSDEFLSLVDTGFFINTSVMPLLKPERKVDVILHLNYSAGSQIQALDQTCKYCSEQGILFPRVDLSEEDRKKLKECYFFDGAETPGAPVLLFFPLVNDTFQKYKAPGQKRSESEMEDGKVDLYGCCSPYSTYSLQYTEKAYDRLVQLAEYNILNNEDLIIQALHTAVARKRQIKK
ncbi:uncharacterized protein LOC125327678 [Corvus hawaiiensis]|uniref:uncharacterized protein LOC125327678 n=1 Tax=Corvus hawaiiensis TaxID=134902 RepID=UPI002018EDA7|nr:uncharacterized protein LOC125327678 [Corvus hawaiiensis]